MSQSPSQDSLPSFATRGRPPAICERMMEAARERRRPMQQQISVGSWPRAEPGRLGEEKQNGPCLHRKLAESAAKIAKLRGCTKQLSARRTIPAPLLIRYCGAEVSEYFLAVYMALAVFKALHRSVAISAHLFRAALADIGKAPPKSARGRAPRARCQSG